MKLHTYLLFFLIPHLSFSQILDGKKELVTQKGFFTYHYEENADKIYLEVTQLDSAFLYVHSLKTGLGSNDIGLDRGQLGGTSIVKFKKAGNKLLLLEPNQTYRAVTNNDAERKSIEQAFGKSVLFGFPILETKGSTYIIDLTPFLMQDTHGVASRLKQQKEGVYKLDLTKSALAIENTKSFPKNTEFEALLTFNGEATGRNLRGVVPNTDFLTVYQHHSFVQLPDDGYEPRVFDPRSGSNSRMYMDYATPVQESIQKRVITRHRLQKKNPEAAISEPIEPIIYYLDPGTPEPVRSALLEGASWWNQAYEAIGYKNAFQVKMLPEDADPMDLRYNVIQWVHRSTRGWSYGSSVVDPRTGEILKGHVSLGSLRIRQDFMIAQALMNKPFGVSDENYEPMLEMALSRIRQLSAHEVGHTLGFAHNFAASTTNRSSVMDYPHPMITLNNGAINFDNAYAKGIGDWDKVIVAYSYGDVPEGEAEKEYLNAILLTAEKKGLRFITDSDARAATGAHPNAHLWDNGSSISQELEDLLALRKTAIANFSIDNIKTGEPLTVLEDVFVPLYFYHRYQTEAATKVIGGTLYNYTVKGDPELTTMAYVSPEEQEQALTAILKTLQAETLAIPKDKLALFPPRAFGYNRTRESFKGMTGVTFDPMAAAATASDFTLTYLFQPERANRIMIQHSVDSKQPSLQAIIEKVEAGTLGKSYKDTYLSEVQETINYNVLKHIMNLAASTKSSNLVKAEATEALNALNKSWLKKGDSSKTYMSKQITSFLAAPDKFTVLPTPKIPDGSPIGSFQCYTTEE